MAMQAEVTILKSPATYTLGELAQIAAEPLRHSGAERAIAFGSYARGTADGYSDLDLVIVLRTDRPPAERWPLLRELLDALPVSVDLLVYTPEEFALGMEQQIGTFDAIVREGVLLYARPGTPEEAFSLSQSQRAIEHAAAIVDAATQAVEPPSPS